MPDTGEMYDAGSGGINGSASVPKEVWPKVGSSASAPNDMPGKDKQKAMRVPNGEN